MIDVNLWRTEKVYISLLAAVQFIHIVDFVILMPLGPTLMNELKVGPAQFASLVSSYNFSAAISGLLFSAIADRFDRKRLLLVSMIGFSLGAYLCSLAAGFETLLIARVITGSFGGILTAIVYAIVSDLIPYKRRGRAMGVIMSAFSLASVLGIPLGLWVADTFGWQKTFILVGSFNILLLGVSHIIFPNLSDCIIQRRPLELFKQYFLILSRKRYLASHLFMFLIGGSMFLLIPFLSPYAVRNIGIATTDLKYMYLVAGLFTIVTARFIGSLTDRFGALKVFTFLGLFSSIPIYFYTNAGPMGLFGYIALSVFFMSVVSGRMIPCMTYLSEIPNPEDRGSFMGILNAVRSLGSATATLIGGLIIVESSERGELLGFNHVGYLSIMMITITVIFIHFLKPRKQPPALVVTPQNIRDF